MTKQEQIKEIKQVLIKTCKRCRPFEQDYMQSNYAEALYNAGYRKADETRKETAKEILLPLQGFLIKRFDYFGELAKRNELVSPDNRLFDLGEQDMANCTLDRVKELLEKYSVEPEE